MFLFPRTVAFKNKAASTELYIQQKSPKCIPFLKKSYRQHYFGTNLNTTVLVNISYNNEKYFLFHKLKLFLYFLYLFIYLLDYFFQTAE